MTKKSTLIATALLAFTMLCVPGFAFAKLTFKFGHAGNPGDYGPHFDIFKQEVEKRSNGEIEILMYGGGQLGNTRVLLESCQRGKLEMTVAGTSVITPLAKKVLTLDLPFLFKPEKTQEIMTAYSTGMIHDFINKEMNRVGMEHVGSTITGFRHYATRNKAFSGFDSLKGIKMASPTSKMEMATAKNFGMLPSPLPSTDRYTALQQGTVDGELISLPDFVNSSRAEVERHIILTSHNYTASQILANKKWWNSLTDEQRKIIHDSARAAEGFAYDRMLEGNKNAEAYCAANGVTLYPLSEKDRDTFVKASAVLREEFKDDLDFELLKEIETLQQ